MTTTTETTTRTLLDPGHGPDPAADALPALLRPLPRRHQEHLDRRGGRPALRPQGPRSGSPTPSGTWSRRLVAFFATGDTIVANNLVLNLYQHINSPEGAALPVAPALRGGGARAVLPDPARHLRPRRDRAARGVRGGREHPVDQGARPTSASGGSTRSSTSTQLETRERPPRVPAQPDLLRGLHRGAVLLRRLRLRLLPALARPAQRAGVGHQLGVPRRVDAHGLRLRRRRHRARGGAGPVRRRARPTRSGRC